jgi:hypothetical protein
MMRDEARYAACSLWTYKMNCPNQHGFAGWGNFYLLFNYDICHDTYSLNHLIQLTPMTKLLLLPFLILFLASCSTREKYILHASDRDHATDFMVDRDTLVYAYKHQKSGKPWFTFYDLNGKTVKYVHYSYSKKDNCISVEEGYKRPKNKTRTCYYPDGTLHWTAGYLGWNLEGRALSFYPNKSPQCICNYHNDKREGVQLIYWNNSHLHLKIMYTESKPMTILRSYDKNGNDLDSGTLKDGDGTLKGFDENGKVTEVEYYEKGVRVKRKKV